MTRKLWLALLLIVLVVAWWSYRQLEHGMRVGDVVAYNVLFYTLALEGAMWGFAKWWFQRDPRQIQLNLMRGNLELARRDKRLGKRIQERGF